VVIGDEPANEAIHLSARGDMDCFAPLAMTLRGQRTGRTVVSLEAYDSRISSSRRPSFLSSFFTALEAAISPWLA
jgi:hypothetical protein